MINSDLIVDPSTSSYNNVNSRSNYKSNSDIDNTNQSKEHLAVEMSPSKVLKYNDSSKIDFGTDSDKKSNTEEINRSSLESNNQELLKTKSLIQSMQYKNTSSDFLKPTEHATQLCTNYL